MDEKISPYSAEIIQTFESLGWALYLRDASMSEAKVTQAGPVEQLILDEGYVLLPLLEGDDALDPMAVQSALDEVAIRVGRDISRLRVLIGDVPTAFLGLTPHEEDVRLHTESGKNVDYGAFIAAIPTFFNRNS
jgi:hypothetical protein